MPQVDGMTPSGYRVRWRFGLRAILELWWVSYPVLVTSLAQLLLTVVDTVLLGRLSTQALAAVALAAPVYLVATVVVRGWATATQILVARRHGAGDTQQITVVTDLGLVLGVLLGAVVGVGLLVLAPTILDALDGGTGLADDGVVYLRILAGAVPLAAATFVLQAAFAGLGATRVAMVMALMVNVVHLPLAWWLIFGAQLGVAGAGLSTLVSTAAGAGYLLWYGRHRLSPPLPTLKTASFRTGRAVVPRMWAIGLPEMSMLFVGYAVELVLLALVARLGTADVAAYRVLDNVLAVSFVGMMAVSTGVAIRAGQRLGAGDADGAGGVYRAGLALALLLAVVPAVPVLVNPRAVLGVFSGDPDVVGAATSAVLVGVVGLLPLAFGSSLVGLLRAAGESRRVMAASFLADFVLLIPLAWLLGLHLGWGLNGIFLAWLAFGLGYSALLYRQYRTGRWRTAVL